METLGVLCTIQFNKDASRVSHFILQSFENMKKRRELNQS